jgi:hypothetical protein
VGVLAVALQVPRDVDERVRTPCRESVCVRFAHGGMAEDLRLVLNQLGRVGLPGSLFG